MMSELQNVTVCLPRSVIQEAKHMAVDQGLSLSRFVAMLVEERVSAALDYAEARQRHLKILEKGFDLGTYGEATWTRDELHER